MRKLEDSLVDLKEHRPAIFAAVALLVAVTVAVLVLFVVAILNSAPQ